jgi:hypothetical protein
MTAADWSDALGAALAMMTVAAGPEVTSQVLDDTFERACRLADKKCKPDAELDRLRRLLDDGLSLEEAHSNIVVLKAGEAPAATVEALVFQLRSGVDALREQGTLTRLARLNKSQARAVAERVHKFKPDIAPAWGLQEVEALLRVWSLRHGQ